MTPADKPPKPPKPKAPKARNRDRRPKLSHEEALALYLRKRTGDMFQNHRKRAKLAGAWLNYTVDDLRRLVKTAIKQGYCPYCQGRLTEQNFGTDHRVPVARAGGFAFENLVVCCQGCNSAKGPLDHVEWRLLLQALNQFAPAARDHTLARLRAGARVVKGGGGFAPAGGPDMVVVPDTAGDAAWRTRPDTARPGGPRAHPR